MNDQTDPSHTPGSEGIPNQHQGELPPPLPPHLPPPSSPPPPPPPPPGPVPLISPAGRVVDPSATQEQRTYCMLMHLTLALATIVPVIGIIAPVLMWQLRRTESAFIDDHGRETVNFHISILIYGAASIALIFLCVGWFVLPAVYVLGIVGMILGSIAANNGEYFRYPMCIRFLRD